MSDLLAVGASGVLAYQTALSTVSENISNAGTAGYSRRTTTLQEITATSSRASASSSTGSGVTVTGINRAADDLRQASVRAAGSDVARSQGSVTWLQSIETALSGNTLQDSLTGFFNAAKTVAADPTASTPRNALIEAGSAVASAFQLTGKALDDATTQLDTTANNAIGQLNNLLASLGQVNDGLGRSQPGTGASAQLLDQRDQLLGQVSAITNTTVSTDALGRVTLQLGDSSGPVALAGDTAAFIGYARNGSGAVSFTVSRQGVTSTLSPTGGALAAVSEGAGRLANARSTLNQIASNFTATINNVQAQGRDLAGNPGAAFFATGATPTDITVAITDPNQIAAAAVGGGTRDNTNINAFETVRQSGGYEASLSTTIAANASTLTARKQVADAQSTIYDGAVAARDNVSGVNLDAEAVDLLRFQQAYQASSRVIQTASDIFQSILQIR
ncbi:flagellar hook-associated protein FlgK [Sphingomonas sp. GlSt437]|uniref:flagellar hook-associated protein FlgK n=1 Tax=Sphingomonas sp. GlSt437 TaxID=3389970 RepID=UPI003A86D7F7